MNKQILLLTAILCSVFGFSQGINFEQGTWKDVLKKAKATNKPVFVDLYTSSCGPFKMMSKDTFLLEEIGTFFNANFISYQLDAEKGEGAEIAFQYQVFDYPTYLFVNADGNLIFRFMGLKPATTFIEKSKVALELANDPKLISDMEKEYREKKNDPAFLFEYIKKLSLLELPNTLLFDEYLKLLPVGECVSANVIDLYIMLGNDLKINTYAFDYCMNNIQVLEEKLPFFLDDLIVLSFYNTANEAVWSKNEQLFNTVLSAYDKLPENLKSQLYKDELYLNYFKTSANKEKIREYSISLSNNYLMTQTKAVIYRNSQSRIDNLEKLIHSGVLGNPDSSYVANVEVSIKEQEMSKVYNKLNEIAWQMFESDSDQKILQDALGWSKRSLELSPDNALFLDTYANLFYKLGNKKEAIATEEKALLFADKKNVDGYKGLEETLRKMKAGEKTWKE